MLYMFNKEVVKQHELLKEIMTNKDKLFISKY